MSTQANNPLHGVKLQYIVEALETHYGWEELGSRISIRCFTFEPSVKSSLKFFTQDSMGKRQSRAALFRHLS